MNELTREAIESIDSSGLLADVLDQPAQLADALWRVESAGIPRRDSPGGLVVCGMGGSAIGGDLARAAIGEGATRPIATARGYGLEPWVGEGTTVLCASYSGSTEETLAGFEAAGTAGADRIALTTGGALAEAARAAGVPVIGVPAGFQPRAAVIYMTVASLECAALCGAAPSMRDEVEAARPLLERLAVEWGPDGAADSPARRVAELIQRAVPVIYGAGATAAVARRWKTQVNENAERHAFASELPEADHNEICGWQGGTADCFGAIVLEDPAADPRLLRRCELTAEIAVQAGVPVERVSACGQTTLERVLSLVLLGDLATVYAAVLAGVDPTPVEPLDRLKAALRDTQ